MKINTNLKMLQVQNLYALRFSGDNVMDEKDEAKQILSTKYQWSKEALRRALNPTPKEARDRPYVRFEGEELTPEQANAIQLLRNEGWELRKIALALSVPDAQVAKFLYNRKMLGDSIEKQFPDE